MAAGLILAKINPTKDQHAAVRDLLSRGWKKADIEDVWADVTAEWTKRRRNIDDILIRQGRFKNETLF